MLVIVVGVNMVSTNNVTTVINGITVPSEPPSAQNNATLVGFDLNGNGVKDDVERLIALKWLSNFADGVMVARNAQLLLTQQGSTIDPSLQRAAFCALSLNKVEESVIMSAILNTEDRFKSYARNVGLAKIYRRD